MVSKNVFLIVAATYCTIIDKSQGQEDCVPSVKSVSIASNATLFWEVDPDRPCEITNFKIDIEGDREDEYHFTVTESFVDLSFLEICEKWQFTVTPISNEVIGFAHTMTSYIPLPPDADLTINRFRFSLSGRTLILEWDLRNQTLGDCTLEYLLTLQDLDRGTIEDAYVEGRTARVDTVSPCITYEMNVRAINQAHPAREGPIARLNLVMGNRAQSAPTLKSVEAKATSLTLTWTLEGDANRCPLRSFYIDGGNYFNVSVPLQGVEDPSTVSMEITGLRSNSMYLMRASVENSGGWSQTTPIAVQTLDWSTD
ncbi:uncharacterized protein LOC108910401 [Anoplophora glabripennis]|uniref:uncharacterized protein LOC108910401 n=1 Tax=Anoplophora glabripennis TaxID=217634 RepID=UPI000874822F|nr:uncharacterized protein LOC108910401 [Anoplophora glabripennis]